ncbi:MAG: L,D-transpeptidase family protein [Acidobacteria bacterium]|nr:L,D-transpeptidase family protein [Acidobacteriota bacterium]
MLQGVNTWASVVRICLFLAVVAIVPCLGPTASAQPAPADATRLSDVARTLRASPAEAADVARVYRARAAAAIWTTAQGIPGEAAIAMTARFEAAATHGLDPAAYRLPAVLDRAALAGDRLAARDVAFTLATLRYMRHLHLGRVDPRRLGLRLQAWDEPHDFAAILADALAAGRVPAAVDALAPPFAVYRALMVALARYRALAGEGLPPVPAVKVSVRAGDTWSGVAAVARRLVVLGDLEAAAAPAPGATTYVEPLVSAVRRFQRRHGLAPDGTIGARTVAALQVPVASRADQIVLALERLRWLPDLGTRRVVAVNIPMFRLWAWEPGPLDQPPVRSMDVIVGRALRTETPVFVETLDHVIFRPYWNVPPSIVRDEVLPAIRRNPRYLNTQQMEIVRGPGDDAVVVPATPEAVAALAAGTLRLRQRPGPHNALGLVKFVFPNRESVYMHGTPSPSLFARDRRDFSHGCIRVADPPALAAWTLSGVPGWTAARISEAMQAAQPERVPVAAPIDVVLFYMTASVGPDDEALHFADDIYGHDRALARALAMPR